MAYNIDYRTFKDRFHLRDIAQNSTFGYILDKKKTTSNWAVLDGPNGDKIIIKNSPSPSNSFFINSDETLKQTDRGDILNFVASRLAKTTTKNLSSDDFKQAVNFLAAIDGTSIAEEVRLSQEKAQRFMSKKKDLKEAMGQTYNFTSLKDDKYLVKERCISPHILKDKRFKDVVGNTLVTLPNGHTFYNTAFPTFDNHNKLVSIEIRNKGSKDNKKYSINALDHTKCWHSTVDKNRPIDKVFYAESAIDAISYYEIMKGYLVEFDNPLFISTGGNLYKEILDNVKILLDDHGCDINTKHVTIFDNDKKGHEYEIQLSTALTSHYFLKDKELNLDPNNQYFDTIEISGNIDPEVQRFLNQINTMVDVKTRSSYGQHCIVKYDAEKNQTRYMLPKSFKENGAALAGLFEKLSGKENAITHALTETDWNDELKALKNPNFIRPTNEKENNTEVKKTHIKR